MSDEHTPTTTESAPFFVTASSKVNTTLNTGEENSSASTSGSDLLASYKELKDAMEQKAKETCPHCGYCPHCGRSTRPLYPYQPWSVPVPWPYPWGTTTICCSTTT